MKGLQINYSNDELKFIKRHRRMPRKELTLLFNKEYGREVSYDNIKALCTRKGLKTGRTGRFEKGHIPAPNARPKGPNKTSFKKEHVPANHKSLWSERISKDGYIEMKVPEKDPHTGFPTRYRLKHRYIWEQANGKIPQGFCLSFIDDDKLNCSINNLELISRNELLQINRLRYSEQPEEFKPTVKMLGKLIASTIERSHEIGDR